MTFLRLIGLEQESGALFQSAEAKKEAECRCDALFRGQERKRESECGCGALFRARKRKKGSTGFS